jgi:two-component system, OmpR family, response regulator
MQQNRYADTAAGRAEHAERGRVLCVAPPQRTTSLLVGTLRSHGFDPQLLRENWSVGATARASGARAVLLDVEMPGMRPAEVLADLHRDSPRTPIIALTTPEARDRTVSTLRATQDDYLVTPFPMEELLARLRLRLGDDRPTQVVFLRRGEVMVDTALEQVFVENKAVSLSRTEFAVVDALIRHPRGQAMSQEELVTRVWGGPPTSNIVEVYIGYLRRKLGAERIRTIRGRGYVLEG